MKKKPKKNIRKINKNEMKKIKGGATINTTRSNIKRQA